ncbi:hypothetical protein L6164_003323 [Bauhinia variegata]|uniref:Uncharacterized protein n=1 Tax=Bauhinia variegata TaxID=167791 RepID=A0ACB9Q121_BAUVA|nr:hypothetical protein L6164_003323 [Bauhinia variegata]
MTGEVELQAAGDLHAAMANDQTNGVVFGGVMDVGENYLGVDETEIWLKNEQEDDLLNDASMFYADFPPLPDFPCMSSSSSSASNPVPVKTVTCSSSSPSASSSSAASWAVLKSDAEDQQYQYHHCYNQHDPVDSTATPAALSSTASMEVPQQLDHGVDNGGGCGGVEDCSIDVMDSFGYMELLENNDFFDPSSIFPNEENPLEDFPQQFQQPEEYELDYEHAFQTQPQAQKEITDPEDQQQLLMGSNNNGEIIQGGSGPDDEMHKVFLEWLKSNKDSVSASDLRSVKLKKSTIECAAKRLGGGKEGMKQLLKLILEWVQTSHLQNKRRKESIPSSNFVNHFQDPCQNQNPNPDSFGLDPNTSFNQTQWIPPALPYVTDPAGVMTPFPQLGYVGGDPYQNGGAGSNNPNGYHPGSDYQMLDSAHSWTQSQFGVGPHYNNPSLPDIHPAANAFASTGYGNQYPYNYLHGPSERLMRLGPSATKEARKKRMARQRRYLSHHRHGNHHSQQNHNLQNPSTDTQTRLGSDNCTPAMAAHANSFNWMYWPSVVGGAPSAAPVVPSEPLPGQPALDRTAMQTQNHHQGRALSDRRQGWKPEKNLRFLLQKVLKQSDVGNLGRIVLPKKEAESHLPELEARDGISIAMEDIGTSRVWNMRYRYWPNNKSRMYLLENTGEFVRANGLQEGDFIVIYSDVKCGKYLIRGVKVRQAGTKAENKKGGGKSQKNQQGNAAKAATAGAMLMPPPSSPNNSQRQKTEKAAKIGLEGRL